MVLRDELEKFLAEFLKVDEFEDYCINGIQVEGKEEINKVLLGVSVSQRLFDQAVREKADAIIVHHGLFWKNDPVPFSLRGILKNRVASLIKNDISLFGYHLPLDAHPQVGNNAIILKNLGIAPEEPIDVGFIGVLPKEMKREDFLLLVNEKLDTQALLFPFGKEKIKTIAAISGASSSAYPLVASKDVDLFIGGEIKENHVREIEEIGLNYIKAGHYNSEKFGVQALGEFLAKEFDIQCKFFDIPNPI